MTSLLSIREVVAPSGPVKDEWIWDDRQHCLTFFTKGDSPECAGVDPERLLLGTWFRVVQRAAVSARAVPGKFWISRVDARREPAMGAAGFRPAAPPPRVDLGVEPHASETAGPRRIVLPLKRFEDFARCMERLPATSWEALKGAVKRLTSRSVGDPDATLHALGEFGYLLLRFARRRVGWRERLRARVRRLRGTSPAGGVGCADECFRLAENLLRWLGPDGPGTAWRLAFDEDLPYARRYQVIEAAKTQILGPPDAGSTAGTHGISARQRRERLWWTLRSQYELARDWHAHEGSRSPEATCALHEASIAYLNVLKDEPHRRELEQFLQEGGSSIEIEVGRILGLRDRRVRPHVPVRERADTVRADEMVRRIFFPWYLKRYNILRALQLVMHSVRGLERTAGILFVAVVVGLPLFDILADRGLLGSQIKGRFDTGGYFSVQSLLQVTALLAFIVLAPNLSRITLPRALFGTLMAWLTVIGAYAFELGSMGASSIHAFLLDGRTGLLVAGGSLLVAYMFMFNEIIGQVSSRTTAAARVLVSLVIMLWGGMFWGLIFARPLGQVLGLHQTDFGTDACLLYLTFIGGCASMVFGILVQLLWDDRSITEPLGEPL